MQYRVLRAFRRDNETYNRGDNIELSPSEAAYLRAQKLIGNGVRTATSTPQEHAAIRHKGNGWYEVQGHKKAVRGKERAEKLSREVDE